MKKVSTLLGIASLFCVHLSHAQSLENPVIVVLDVSKDEFSTTRKEQIKNHAYVHAGYKFTHYTGKKAFNNCQPKTNFFLKADEHLEIRLVQKKVQTVTNDKDKVKGKCHYQFDQSQPMFFASSSYTSVIPLEISDKDTISTMNFDYKYQGVGHHGDHYMRAVQNEDGTWKSATEHRVTPVAVSSLVPLTLVYIKH